MHRFADPSSSEAVTPWAAGSSRTSRSDSSHSHRHFGTWTLIRHSQPPSRPRGRMELSSNHSTRYGCFRSRTRIGVHRLGGDTAPETAPLWLTPGRNFSRNILKPVL